MTAPMDPGLEIMTRLGNYWLYGVLGGLIQDLLSGGALALPSYDGKCGKIRMGMLGSAIIGIGAAVLVDGGFATAFSAAIAGPYVLENLVEKTVRRYKPGADPNNNGNGPGAAAA